MQPATEWPSLPAFGELSYVRHALYRVPDQQLAAGAGAAAALQLCDQFQHPHSRKPPLDPFLERALHVASAQGSSTEVRFRRLAFWTNEATLAGQERDAWLASLPSHAASLYGQSGFNGPLFGRMHAYLVSLGYPDRSLFDDVCQGMPSGGVLPRSRLWPLRRDLEEALRARTSRREVYKAAPGLVRGWRRSRRSDPCLDALLERNKQEVRLGRRQEVDLSSLPPGSYVAHPEFMSMTRGKGRPCNDCSVSGWYDATAAQEKLRLCSTDDVLDYGTRLLERDASAAPCLAVADEDSAFRNWATRLPDAMIMLVFLGSGRVSAWRDHAMCFGDLAAVFGYNRIRTFLTMFFRVEYAMAVWSYYDDSAIVEPRRSAYYTWYIFLRTHEQLQIPIKGNPLSLRSVADSTKFFPPAGDNKFLGEMTHIGSLPCSAGPTQSRQQAGRAMIDVIIVTMELPSGDASSVFGSLRFLGSELYGRCGLPALQPIAARQHQRAVAVTPALLSGLRWLRCLLGAVGPREWPRSDVVHTLWIIGDASEPASGPPILAGILRLPGAAAASRAFQLEVPAEVVRLLPKQKKIYYYEVLWAVAATFVWRAHTQDAHPIYFEDNTGAQASLLRGFSNDFAASLFLAGFWGAAAGQSSRPWVARVASDDNPADCLTKGGLDSRHLQSAIMEEPAKFDDFWSLIVGCLKDSEFPQWDHFNTLFKGQFQ